MNFRRPWAFPALAVLIYALVALIPLSMAGWDVSRFIVAGSHFVDKTKLPSPIRVRENSDGYDGQFYYRLAVDPNATVAAAYGIKLDVPSWRMQRIGYPVAAYILSLAQPALVPWALFSLNLLCIGAVAFMVTRLQSRLRLPEWLPWAVMLWPGFTVTLTHDTTEIMALALLVAAISFYLEGRTIAYAIIVVLSSLTRETSILVYGGIGVYEGVLWLRNPTRARFWRVAVYGLALLPFLVWRQFLIARWGMSPQVAGTGNIGIPFGGMADTLWESLTGSRASYTDPVGAALHRIVMGVAVITMLGTGLLTALRIPALWRRTDRLAGLVTGWVIMAALLSTMTAAVPGWGSGPWIDPNAAFRAYSEYWFVTLLLLAATKVRVPRWAAVPSFLIWGIAIGITV